MLITFSQLRKHENVLRLKDRREKSLDSKPKAAIEDLKLTSSFYDRNRAGGRNPDRHRDRHAPRRLPQERNDISPAVKTNILDHNPSRLYALAR